MIVSCPNCGTQFNVPDHMYQPGRKSRCANCLTVFQLPALPEPDEPKLSPYDEELFSRLAEEHAQHEDESPAAKAKPSRYRNRKDADEHNGVELPGSAKPKKKLSVYAIAVIIILVVGLVAAGVEVLLLLNKNSADDKNGGTAQTEDSAPKIPEVAQAYMALKVESKNFLIRNTTLGDIFVVTGKVVNNFEKPKSFIVVELNIYDENDKVIFTKRQYCGTTLSQTQLEVLEEGTLQNHLANQYDIMLYNTKIPVRGSVPFMIAVPHPPKEMRSFSIAPVSAKDIDEPMPSDL